jgi:type IV pilus assembly protein PilM
MLNSKSFLTVDFGAGSLKLAEFEVNEAGGLRLKQFGIKPLGAEGSQESAREGVMLKALQELIAERGIRAKDVNVCAPGFHVFSKFVKLPPVDASKVTQIIQYEAQQNVPFPLAEVVWDYQILGSAPSGELEVLLVAIKTDIVEGIFRVAESSGLRLQLADVSPAALCNAFRYNYADLDDCTMLLDIGAKTSNLLFFEKGKVYSRSINLGANSITQDFANESKLRFPDAEQKKIAEGFVSLGGAYEEPENAHQAAISKIARQFMTRLHIQVNQTMQFYRGQQGGSAPQRLFLSGGASLMPYTAQFFAEKLNVPVEYFNPFRNVEISPEVNLEDLSRVAHSLGEVVGLGLRNLAHCPVELNLMPESTLSWVQFNEKKPYFIASIFSLALVVIAAGFLFNRLAETNRVGLEHLRRAIGPLMVREGQFKNAISARDSARKDVQQVSGWLQERYYWADVLTELHRILIQVEAKTASDLRRPTGVWIEKFISNPAGTDALTISPGAAPTPTPAPTATPAATPADTGAAPGDAGGGLSQREKDFRAAHPELFGGAAAQPQQPTGATPPPPPPQTAQMAPAPTPVPRRGAAATTNELSVVQIVCRGVDVGKDSGNASANRDLQGALIEALQQSPLFEKDPNLTKLAGDYNEDPASGTFTFGIQIKLKRPLAL